MTYEFAKHVADNLRFGSYDGKWNIDEDMITINDVNSNTFIEIMLIKNIVEYHPPVKWYQKQITKKETWLRIIVNTGTVNPKKYIQYYTNNNMDSHHPDYKFWDEFFTWVKAKWDDKVYKHNCLIEEAFVL